MSAISLLVIILVFSVPIIAILSQTYLKAKGTDEGKDKIGKKDLAKLLEAMESMNEENKILRKRVENLETIVANENWIEKLTLPENTSQKDIEKLAKLLKKKD